MCIISVNGFNEINHTMWTINDDLSNNYRTYVTVNVCKGQL